MLSRFLSKDKILRDIANLSYTNSLKKPYKIHFSSVELMFLKYENRRLNKKCADINIIDKVAHRVKNNMSLTVKDVALYFDVGEQTIRKWHKRFLKDTGKSNPPGKSLRFRQEFIKYVEENCIK